MGVQRRQPPPASCTRIRGARPAAAGAVQRSPTRSKRCGARRTGERRKPPAACVQPRGVERLLELRDGGDVGVGGQRGRGEDDEDRGGRERGGDTAHRTFNTAATGGVRSQGAREPCGRRYGMISGALSTRSRRKSRMASIASGEIFSQPR